MTTLLGVRRIRREVVVDAVLGGAVTLVVAFAITADIGGRRGPDVGAYLFALGLGLLMLMRRRYPGLTLVATGVGISGYYIADYPPIGLALPLAAALYSAAERGKVLFAGGYAALLLLGSLFFRIGEEEEGLGYLLGYETPWSAAIMAGAIALGDGVRSRHLRLAQQREREAELLRAADAAAAQRVQAERLALARDLHDALAHTTTVIALQAHVAREALDDADLAAARSALEVISTASGEANRELRTTVSLLRQPADVSPLAPVGSLTRLDRLAAATAESGLPVDVQVHGDPRPLPSLVDSTAYRIVQEALTNAVRHSGARRVEVLVHYADDTIRVIVRDDGRGGVEDAGAGHGLAGMGERAELLGGALTAGPRKDMPGFEVRAVLPVASAAVTTTVDVDQS
jgi:signal transduction histidine kinase